MSLKHEVLLRLRQAGGDFVSGQELADTLSVSRAAVWKAITALRSDGAVIESVTNRGYRLAKGCDLLSAELISASLRHSDLRVTVFDSIDSTNNEAKRRLAGGFTGVELVVAAEQTAGRGRMGRTFYSPAQTGLYMSLALACPDGFENAVCSTTAAAVAVVRAIEQLTPAHPLIKWVNDIYLDGRKICGILTEGVTDFESGTLTGIVIGIGVNLHTRDFPEEIGMTAASLGEAAPGRCVLSAAIADELLDIVGALPDRSFMDFYREKSLVLGHRVTYSSADGAHSAEAVGIDDFGGLIVRKNDGNLTTLSSGEISVRLQ